MHSFPQNGSLFEADFILLDGIPANVIRGEPQYLAAPLVMLRMDPSGKLLPMAIQVRLPRYLSPDAVLCYLNLCTQKPNFWVLGSQALSLLRPTFISQSSPR